MCSSKESNEIQEYFALKLSHKKNKDKGIKRNSKVKLFDFKKSYFIVIKSLKIVNR